MSTKKKYRQKVYRWFVRLTLPNVLNQPKKEFMLFHPNMTKSTKLKILIDYGYDKRHPKAETLMNIIKFTFTGSELEQIRQCLSLEHVENIMVNIFSPQDAVSSPSIYKLYSFPHAITQNLSMLTDRKLPFPIWCFYFN